MKKIKKISLGRALYLSITKKYLVVGRPFASRHVSIEEDDGNIVAHLTDVARKTHTHLGTLKLSTMKQFEERLRHVAAEAFFNNIFSVTAVQLEEQGFKLLTPKAFGLSFARMILQARKGSALRLRAPSERDVETLARQLSGRLCEPDQLDQFMNAGPGTVSAVWISADDSNHVVCFPLYYLPHAVHRPDGRTFGPGWYFLRDREVLARAHSQVFVEFAGEDFFRKLERALRFLKLPVPVSPVEMEDVFRRHAAGESFEDIRASRKS